MKHLYLLRHGKSSWDDPNLADIDRPLAPRGVRALARMNRYLDTTRVHPDLVICSPARRTRETLKQVEPALGRGVTVRIERDAYSGGATTLAALLRSSPDSASSLMLIGHNPALQDLALSLAAGRDDALLARLAQKFPTGALAVIALPHPTWRELGREGGRLEDLVVPRELR